MANTTKMISTKLGRQLGLLHDLEESERKKLQWKIQSHDWDKNKSWMPLLGKLINMKR